MNKFIFQIIFLLLISTSLYPTDYTIYCGKLIHPQNGEVWDDATIYVKNGIISGLFKGKNIERGKLIDLGTKTVMPGLMDMHLHFHTEMNPQAYSNRTKLNTEDYAIGAAVNAEKTLMAGFTTIRDLGSPKHVSIALRNAIDKGIVEGPRIIAAAQIAFGTDSGVYSHGDNWKEFIYMTEGGMSPMEAIKSATVEASKLIEMDDKLGSIELGKIADIIAVDGNPLEDINAMGKVIFVMKNGIIYKNKLDSK